MWLSAENVRRLARVLMRSRHPQRPVFTADEVADLVAQAYWLGRWDALQGSHTPRGVLEGVGRELGAVERNPTNRPTVSRPCLNPEDS